MVQDRNVKILSEELLEKIKIKGDVVRVVCQQDLLKKFSRPILGKCAVLLITENSSEQARMISHLHQENLHDYHVDIIHCEQGSAPLKGRSPDYDYVVATVPSDAIVVFVNALYQAWSQVPREIALWCSSRVKKVIATMLPELEWHDKKGDWHIASIVIKPGHGLKELVDDAMFQDESDINDEV